MKRALSFALWLLTAAPALAISHFQADRIHIFNAGSCAAPTGPLWITIGTGMAAPGFVNVTAPGFDQIGALVSGNGPGQSEAVLAAQSPGCGVIAGFYREGTPVGAWIVPPAKLPELVAILKANG